MTFFAVPIIVFNEAKTGCPQKFTEIARNSKKFLKHEELITQ